MGYSFIEYPVYVYIWTIHGYLYKKFSVFLYIGRQGHFRPHPQKVSTPLGNGVWSRPRPFLGSPGVLSEGSREWSREGWDVPRTSDEGTVRGWSDV